jgi:hypothetical protein
LLQSIVEKLCYVALELHDCFTTLTEHRQTYPYPTIRTNMKAQHETTIQFSGYPLTIADEKAASVKAELTVVKSTTGTAGFSLKESIANDPQNWDVDWFNSYE